MTQAVDSAVGNSLESDLFETGTPSKLVLWSVFSGMFFAHIRFHNPKVLTAAYRTFILVFLLIQSSSAPARTNIEIFKATSRFTCPGGTAFLFLWCHRPCSVEDSHRKYSRMTYRMMEELNRLRDALYWYISRGKGLFLSLKWNWLTDYHHLHALLADERNKRSFYYHKCRSSLVTCVQRIEWSSIEDYDSSGLWSIHVHGAARMDNRMIFINQFWLIS